MKGHHKSQTVPKNQMIKKMLAVLPVLFLVALIVGVTGLGRTTQTEKARITAEKRETIEATRKTNLAAQKRLEAEQQKFGVGLATAYDVLVFQDSYAQALINEKRALIDLAKARAELDRVQGIVSFRNGKES